MMAVGTPSATAAVLRVQTEDAAPETSRLPASPLVTAEGPTEHGTPLAHPGSPLRAWERDGLHDQCRFGAARVSAARTSADPLLAIPLSLGRVGVIPRSDHLETRDSDQARTCSAARDSIPLAATADSATGDLAGAGVGTGTVGAGIALELSAGAATVGTEAFGLATTTTVGAVAFLERALAWGWPYWGSYWGPAWAFGWDPWWYDPYWYSPSPSYNYYQAYPDVGYNDAPSYEPDALSDYDSSSSYLITPTLNPEALHFNVSDDAGLDDHVWSRRSAVTEPRIRRVLPEAEPHLTASRRQ